LLEAEDIVASLLGEPVEEGVLLLGEGDQLGALLALLDHRHAGDLPQQVQVGLIGRRCLLHICHGEASAG
jgi:hypothetical protein